MSITLPMFAEALHAATKKHAPQRAFRIRRTKVFILLLRQRPLSEGPAQCQGQPHRRNCPPPPSSSSRLHFRRSGGSRSHRQRRPAPLQAVQQSHRPKGRHPRFVRSHSLPEQRGCSAPCCRPDRQRVHRPAATRSDRWWNRPHFPRKRPPNRSPLPQAQRLHSVQGCRCTS